MTQSGVYVICNTKTGSEYVGSATNIPDRWKSHRSSLKNHNKSPPKLQRAWDKHGAESFEFRVLCECPPKDCLKFEQYYIDVRKPKYNTRADASSNFGIRWSAETNAKKGRTDARYTIKGVTGSIWFLCRHFGVVTQQGAAHRIKVKGWSVEDAILTPGATFVEIGRMSVRARAASGFVPKGADLEFRGVRGTLKRLVELFSECDYYAVRARRSRGWPLEKALLQPAREWPKK